MNYIIIFLISMIPLAELRVAIPTGIAMGVSVDWLMPYAYWEIYFQCRLFTFFRIDCLNGEKIRK